MKKIQKICVLLAALFIFTGTANAKIINWGIKAGLNVNHLSFNKDFGETLFDKSNSVGWEGGLMAEFDVPVIKGLCFDASLMYARMNNSTNASYEIQADPNGNNPTSSIESFNGDNVGKNFLMIPINIKYKFEIAVLADKLSPYIFTGPEFGFKLDKNTMENIKTRTCQVAWNIGVGVQLINHLQIGASYGFGINNIAEHVFRTQQDDVNVKNNYWTVSAAWLF